MKSKKIGIFCADLHFRDDQPKCREDDFFQSQIGYMKWLKDLSRQLSLPVYVAGDYFHHWKPSPRLLSTCIQYMPHAFVIPGNHDLPNHSLELLNKSGLWTLSTAGKVTIEETKLGELAYFPLEDFNLFLIHELVDEKFGTTAESLFKKTTGKTVIIAGDNHKTFTCKSKDGKHLLINPGSFTRQTADQIDHRPCVFILYDNLEFDLVFVPINNDVISEDHLIVAEEREERMGAFVSSLNDDYEIELSFEKNLVNYLKANRNRKSVEEMIWESLDQ